MDIVDVLRWLLAVPLGVVGVLLTVCNYACIVVYLVRRRHSSVVPLIGGGSLTLSWLLCPMVGGRSWAWIPLAIDPGCWVVVLAGLYFLVWIVRRWA